MCNYDDYSMSHDIAILRLNNNITDNNADLIRPIKLDLDGSENDVEELNIWPEGYASDHSDVPEVTVMGWGNLIEGKSKVK